MPTLTSAIGYNQRSWLYCHPRDLLQLGGAGPGQPIPAPGHVFPARGAPDDTLYPTENLTENLPADCGALQVIFFFLAPFLIHDCCSDGQSV